MDWEDAKHEVQRADWREAEKILDGLEISRNKINEATVRGVRDSHV